MNFFFLKKTFTKINFRKKFETIRLMLPQKTFEKKSAFPLRIII